jgi:hypothetical protein
MSDDLVSKWKLTGLLEGNEGFSASRLSENLEACADFLIEKANSGSDVGSVAGVALPIIVRLANERNIWSIDMPRVYNEILEFFGGKNLSPDEEAEECSRFVEEFRE